MVLLLPLEPIQLPLVLKLLNKCMDTMYTDPAEGGLLVIGLIRLFNQTNTLKYISDIVKAPYLCF